MAASKLSDPANGPLDSSHGGVSASSGGIPCTPMATVHRMTAQRNLICLDENSFRDATRNTHHAPNADAVCGCPGAIAKATHGLTALKGYACGARSGRGGRAS